MMTVNKMTKSQILFELRRHIHLLEHDELSEILEGDVESIHSNFIINFANNKQIFITCNGSKYWLLNNDYHREDDKPAIIYLNGYREWWFKGEKYQPKANL